MHAFAGRRSYNPILPLLARVGLGGLFVFFGIRSIIGWAGSVAYFTKLGFPAPEAMVAIAIIIQIVAGFALIIGWQTRWAAWLLVLYVLIAALMGHRYWEYDGVQYANQMQHFFKNMAIIGGLLMLAAFGPGSMSVDKS
jgi:putative oxidoreductase